MSKHPVERIIKVLEQAKVLCGAEIQRNRARLEENMRTYATLNKYLLECRNRPMGDKGALYHGLIQNMEDFAERVIQAIQRIESENHEIKEKVSGLEKKYSDISTKETILDKFIKKHNEEKGKATLKKMQNLMNDMAIRYLMGATDD